jgi:dienelactone hydrolase
VLVLAPTARDRTWSIMGGPDVDAEPLREMVASVAARYPVDGSRVLLTGMSDGATYAFLCGLRDDMPFTHLAPACGVLHPFLFAIRGLERARDRPIYVVHGALDWMFPLQTARMSRRAPAASAACAPQLDDLSHTYPRDENARSRLADRQPTPRGRRSAARYGLRITRVAAVPAFFPCHSAIAKAAFTSLSAKLWETSVESGYVSRVRTRKSRAAGTIQGL